MRNITACASSKSDHVIFANAAMLLTKEKVDSPWLDPILIWARFRDKESRILLRAV